MWMLTLYTVFDDDTYDDCLINYSSFTGGKPPKTGKSPSVKRIRMYHLQ